MSSSEQFQESLAKAKTWEQAERFEDMAKVSKQNLYKLKFGGVSMVTLVTHPCFVRGITVALFFKMRSFSMKGVL